MKTRLLSARLLVASDASRYAAVLRDSRLYLPATIELERVARSHG